jgi:TldD protein
VSQISRRRFLARSGASIAGAALAGALGKRLFDASPLGAQPASAVFPGPLLEILSSIVGDLEKKFPYASALYTSYDGVDIRQDRRGKSVSETPFLSRGVSLRVWDGAAFHEIGVAGQSPGEILAAAKRFDAIAPAKERYRIEPLAAHEEGWRTRMEVDPASLSLADRAARIEEEFHRCNWDDPRVRNVTIDSQANHIRRVFVDRTRKLSSESVMINHSLVLFGFDGGKPGLAFVRNVGQGGLELATITGEAFERAKRDLVDMFRAEPVPPGEYEVVLAPEVSGLLAHESFGHGVEMDQFVKRRAKAQEFLGRKVASEIVDLVDDPSIPGARGSYPFDDEGVLARPTRIIENGVFVQPLTDLMSATFLGTGRTPNGRTQAWDRKVYARMSNTFFAPGTSEVDELFDGLAEGLYLQGFRNGIEDPHGWGIQFTATRAREVKNGKLTGKVFAPATVTGYVPEILSSITMIATDFEIEPGTCGKGHKEYVPVGSGGPHLRTRARVS